MQSVPQPILKYARKRSVRVLRPWEYSAIHSVGSKTRLDALLYTGARYIELQRFHDNPGWLDTTTKAIHLPPTAILKGKRRQLDRWIRLNTPGVSAVESYLQGRRLPSWEAWTWALKDWAKKAKVDPRGLGPKTLRKTWESWLVVSFPERSLQIAQNQGHTTATSLMYYLNVPFNSEEKEQMRPYVEGVF
jgi:integrase